MTDTKPRASTEDRIRAALWFAERGFGVFPVWSTIKGVCRCPLLGACTNPGKHPITPKGFKDATRDPGLITTFLSAASEPNYGLVCPDGVFVLDVDGADGLAKWTELEAELGTLETLRTQTANGLHVFARWPDSAPRPLKQMFGYVTRWGSGSQAGYVIGPRSIHASGFEYEPTGGMFEIATLPEAWAQKALQGERPVATFTVGGDQLPDVGHRHEWLRNRARYYRGVGMEREVLRVALLAENARLAEPKTEADVDRAIGEVFEKFGADPPEQIAATVERRLEHVAEPLGLLGALPGADFPPEPDEIAFEGILGECVDDLAAGTDASRVGLLGCLIAFAGVLIPGQAYFHRLQTSSPYVALVGESSIGRKGTAMMRVADAMGDALGIEHANRVVMDGLASGEGLVTALHWKQTTFPNEPTVGLVFEEEYATLLAARAREGSTLDPKMRQGFDGGVLSNRKAGEQKNVMPPYWLAALIAITPSELRERLEAGAMTSGSANRWLYLPVIRRDVIPTNEPPRFRDERRRDLADARKAAMRPTTGPLKVDPDVVKILAEYADWLPTISYGLSSDLVKRLGVIAFRIALVHALAEIADEVSVGHLRRGLALVEYSRLGMPWVFGHTIGNRDADLLYRRLLEHTRLRKTEITRDIIRDPIRQQAAIDELLRIRVAHIERQQTEGRPSSELVLTGTSFHSFHSFHSFTTEPLERHIGNVERMERSPLPSVDGLERTWKKGGKKVEESPPSVEQWCHFFRDHQSRHRDVQTKQPWCEICTPRPA